MAVVGRQVEQQVAQEIAGPSYPQWIETVIDLVENRPTVLVVLLLIAAVWWLVKKLQAKDKIIAGKDDVNSRLTNTLVNLHKDGVPLDEPTQFTIGVKPTRRKTKR